MSSTWAPSSGWKCTALMPENSISTTSCLVWPSNIRTGWWRSSRCPPMSRRMLWVLFTSSFSVLYVCFYTKFLKMKIVYMTIFYFPATCQPHSVFRGWPSVCFTMVCANSGMAANTWIFGVCCTVVCANSGMAPNTWIFGVCCTVVCANSGMAANTWIFGVCCTVVCANSGMATNTWIFGVCCTVCKQRYGCKHLDIFVCANSSIAETLGYLVCAVVLSVQTFLFGSIYLLDSKCLWHLCIL